MPSECWTAYTKMRLGVAARCRLLERFESSCWFWGKFKGFFIRKTFVFWGKFKGFFYPKNFCQVECFIFSFLTLPTSLLTNWSRSSFWLEIAQKPAYRNRHRQIAIFLHIGIQKLFYDALWMQMSVYWHLCINWARNIDVSQSFSTDWNRTLNTLTFGTSPFQKICC